MCAFNYVCKHRKRSGRIYGSIFFAVFQKHVIVHYFYLFFFFPSFFLFCLLACLPDCLHVFLRSLVIATKQPPMSQSRTVTSICIMVQYMCCHYGQRARSHLLCLEKIGEDKQTSGELRNERICLFCCNCTEPSPSA